MRARAYISHILRSLARQTLKKMAVDIEPKVGSIRAVVIEPKVTCALFWDLENF